MILLCVSVRMVKVEDPSYVFDDSTFADTRRTLFRLETEIGPMAPHNFTGVMLRNRKARNKVRTIQRLKKPALDRFIK